MTLRPKHASIRSLIAERCTAGKGIRREPFSGNEIAEIGEHDLSAVEADIKFSSMNGMEVQQLVQSLYGYSRAYILRVKSLKLLERNEVSLTAPSVFSAVDSIVEGISIFL